MPSSKILKVTPMNHAEKCPVCSGFGTVGKLKKECHACFGSGFVIVPNFTDEHLSMNSNILANIVSEEDENER